MINLNFEDKFNWMKRCTIIIWFFFIFDLFWLANSLYKRPILFMLDFHFHFYLIPFLEEMVSNLKFYRNGFIPQNFYHRPTRIRRRCNLTWKFSHCFISRKCFWRDELIVSKRLRVERVYFELGKFLYQKKAFYQI